MARLTAAELREKASRTQRATKKAHEDGQERRAARKSSVSFENIEPPPDRQTAKRVLNSKEVRGWFDEALAEKYGEAFIVPTWTVHQMKLAKDLLKVYGAELVRKAVEFFVKSWDAIEAGSGGKLTGAPSINLLFGMRERIFGDVQRGKAPLKFTDKRRISEYQGPVDRGIGTGW